MTSFYDRHIMPRLIGCACASSPIMKQRAKVVPKASGNVLELGIGGGLNLASYDVSRVERVTGIDPSAELIARAELAPHSPDLKVDIQKGTAENLPFDPASFDCVVCTFTLCSVQDPARVLSEAARVLKPGGRFLFCEHGLAPDQDVVRWQKRVEPVWKRLAGGCHLTRPITSQIEASGFRITETQGMYLPGTPRLMGWSEWGEATIS
jgi:ubiquinone/menaquinone biosynthesis C-methylase UbiE